MNTETLPRITQFSTCRRYRYTLWREFYSLRAIDPPLLPIEGNEAHNYLMVIGLNPSTADENTDDPTIRKCIGFAKRWGFGALCMTNLFAWRDTKPENMKKAGLSAQGPDNDDWLFKVALGAGMILAAWGKHGSHHGRARQVLDALGIYGREVQALKLNSDGSPMHPLYAPYESRPLLIQ